jgi:ribosome biogenesis protein Nip4
MKTQAIMDFALQLGVKLSFDEDLIFEKSGRYFLLNDAIKPFVQNEFFFAGAFLGKVKDGKFFPSFILLGMLADKKANRIVADGKASWLFICGRDIFKKGILKTYGSFKRNSVVLVLNEFGECLGFGRIKTSIESARKNEVVVQNVSDIGDFLRRERGL